MLLSDSFAEFLIHCAIHYEHCSYIMFQCRQIKPFQFEFEIKMDTSGRFNTLSIELAIKTGLHHFNTFESCHYPRNTYIKFYRR